MAVVDELILAATELSNFCNKSITKIEKDHSCPCDKPSGLCLATPHTVSDKMGRFRSDYSPWYESRTVGDGTKRYAFRLYRHCKKPTQNKTSSANNSKNAPPKRPIVGLDLERQEISGQRLWSLMFDHYGDGKTVFSNIFVLNHCPLLLLGESGKNLTPDNLPQSVMKPILAACDKHLKQVVDIMGIERIIGVGKYAEKRAKLAFKAIKAALARQPMAVK